MTTAEQLTQVFVDNFVAYYRSHVAHANIEGRNFASDHELLGDIYADLQGQIDITAELLRSIEEYMPMSLSAILDQSQLSSDPIEGTSDELLEQVLEDIEALKSCYQELMTVADDDGHKEIANYAQDRILALAKFAWMLRSTLS